MPKQCIYSKYICTFSRKCQTLIGTALNHFSLFWVGSQCDSQKWTLRPEFRGIFFFFFSLFSQPGWKLVIERKFMQIWNTVSDIQLCCFPLNYRTFNSISSLMMQVPTCRGGGLITTCFNTFAPSHLRPWYISRNKG